MVMHLIDASERAASGLAHQEDAGPRATQGSTKRRGKLA
jgi:hypothetical protein